MVTKKPELAEVILDKVDPNMILVGALGATATLGGITPPLTKLLMAFGGDGLDADIQKIVGLIEISNPVTLMPGILNLVFGGSSDNTQTTDPRKFGLAASGALEAMLMYTLFQNPEFMKGIMALPSSIIGSLKGVTTAIPAAL